MFSRTAWPPLILTSKNPCYAQATWDWICLKKKTQKSKTKQKQTNKQKTKN